MTVRRLTQQAAIPPVSASPERTLHERFRAAAQVLTERGGSFTDAQEAAFTVKWAELVDLYEAEHPGKQSPALRYGRGDPPRLEPIWPSGMWATK